MTGIILIDTSIYLNILDVPGCNQQKAEVISDFKQFIADGDSFLLPLATVWETGNHIADLPNGGLRWQFASKLVRDVTNAFNGETPYRATFFPEREIFLQWLGDFPRYAKLNKSDHKIREGVSLADLSIIKEFERLCTLAAMSRVRIWSLDSDLLGYDRQP